MRERVEYIELADLQDVIKERIGFVEQWVKVEIESHRVVSGHHYLNVIQKLPSGALAARASARIWRSKAGIVNDFEARTGQTLDAGISVVVRVSVDYSPVYGLALTINEIDPGYTVGVRELERKETIRKLTESGLMERQSSLSLPFLPSSVAVISSRQAAGYGDFVKHLEENPRGYRFNCTLFQAMMQGDNASSSISGCIADACSSGKYDVILILRGGGSEADLYCYDDYVLAKTIAESDIPVLTAIGHERDYHVADMVSYAWFKTPTALADALIEWVDGVERGMEEALDSVLEAISGRLACEEKQTAELYASIRYHLSERTNTLKNATLKAVSAIVCSASVRIREMSGSVERLLGSIQLSDPRNVLSQGYVLAVDSEGQVLKSVHSSSKGEVFVLRFRDGRWECRIENVVENDK